MRYRQIQILMLVLMVTFFGACSTDKKKPSPVAIKVSQIQKTLLSMGTSYGEKDEKALFESFDAASDALSLLRTRIVGDFEYFESAEIAFVFDRVEVEEGRIKTIVRWKGKWLQTTDAPPIERRGKAILFWNDVAEPKLIEVRGNAPFGVFR